MQLFFSYDKSMKSYYQALLVLGSFLLVFVWQNSQFQAFTVPAIGFLVFMFLIISIRNKHNLNFGGPLNFFLLNSVLLLFIFSTGGISSSLFFLLYFLLFGAAFIMNPRVVFIFPIAIIIIFWSQIFQNDITSNLIKMGSLILLTPLAYLFGTQFSKSQKNEDEVLKTKERETSAADEIAEDVGDVIESAKTKLTAKEVDKLNEILEETEDLRDEK